MVSSKPSLARSLTTTSGKVTRTRLTAMVVTHDVDEAILLADRVVMMTNGPNARVGKVLDITLPRPRSRKALLEHPDYYRLREELLSFLADCDRH